MPDRRFFEEQAKRRQARGVGREQEAQAAMARLASSAEPKDRFGQVLTVGDMVLYDPPAPNVFILDDIVKTSALDPTAPPGLVTLRMRAEFNVVLNALQLPQNMIRVGFSTPNGEKQIAAPQTPASEFSITKIDPAPLGQEPIPVGADVPEKPESASAMSDDAPRIALAD